MKDLTIAPIWNKVAEQTNGRTRELKTRDYITASDIGGAFIDRYYKMSGEKVTNPFDTRILRIFDAGKVSEWIVTRALALAGVLKEKQGYLEIPESKDYLKILGYFDCTIGGFGNWDEARERMKKWLEEYKLSMDDEIIERYSMAIIDGLEKTYGNKEIPETMVEIKSVNSRAFWNDKSIRVEGKFTGYDHNKFQTMAYLIAKKLKRGLILYLSRDDFSMEEVPIFRGGELEKKFWVDIGLMTHYYQNKIVPPKEEEVIFDERRKKFQTNWKVLRSAYLTKIYGYKDQDAFKLKHHQTLLDINRAMRHLEAGKVKDEDKPVIKKWNIERLVS